MELNDANKLLKAIVENELRFRALMDILTEKNITNYEELNSKLEEAYSNAEVRVKILEEIIK